jgi:hypothetical protein
MQQTKSRITNTVLLNISQIIRICRPSSEQSVQHSVASLKMEEAETCCYRRTDVFLIHDFVYFVGRIFKLNLIFSSKTITQSQQAFHAAQPEYEMLPACTMGALTASCLKVASKFRRWAHGVNIWTHPRHSVTHHSINKPAASPTTAQGILS